MVQLVQIREILKGKHTGESVRIRGWAYRCRASNKMAFAVVRDTSDIIQCATTSDSKAFMEAKRVTLESSVAITGKVQRDKRAPGGYELRVSDFEIISLAEPFPIAKDLSDEFLLDIRHLWIRSRPMNAAFKVRSTVFGAIHEFFRKNGFYEIQAPSFVSGACEGGSTLFELEYFGKKAYLTQSWQLYAEAMATSLEKIYTVAPSFRAEKSRTRKHLTEFWHNECEAAWYHLDDIMEVEDKLVSHIAQSVAKENRDELAVLGRDPDYLKRIKPPFEHITYDDAINILRKKGFKVKWGDDISTEAERRLTEGHEKPIQITHYPASLKVFYHRLDPENPKVCLCNDMIAPDGYSEIIGSGEREYDYDILIRRMKEGKMDPKDYQWYLDLRRYGSVPHSGFGLGIDRVVSWVAGLEHIRDAIPFPRTINRVYP